MEQKNYIALSRFPILFRQYAFVDVDDHLADSLFIRHKVRVRFGKEFAHPEHDYILIFCKIRKNDEKPFLDALGELSNKMILFGHPDYDEFCHKAVGALEAAIDRRKKAPAEQPEVSAIGAEQCPKEGIAT